MKRLGLLLVLGLVFFARPVHTEGDDNKLFIKLKSKQVCSGRLKECFPIAIGKASHPTPVPNGPVTIFDIRRNGFDWRNPLTGQKFPKGTHSLGPYWIQLYHNPNTGWDYGIHATPYPNIPLHLQESHGCLRGHLKDVRKLAYSVEMLDVAIFQETE